MVYLPHLRGIPGYSMAAPLCGIPGTRVLAEAAHRLDPGAQAAIAALHAEASRAEDTD